MLDFVISFYGNTEIFCFFFNKICYSFIEVSEFIYNKATKTFSFVAFFVVSTPETLV